MTDSVVRMVPLQVAWEKIGDEISMLNKRRAAVCYEGMFIMGTLYISGTKATPHVMFTSRHTCDELGQNWRVFWPRAGQSELNQFNFDGCIVENLE